MKKRNTIFTVILIVTMLSMMLTFMTANVSAAGVTVSPNALLAATAPTIDGTMADGEWIGTMYTLNKGNAFAGTTDITYDFYFMWDATNFYVACVSNDTSKVERNVSPTMALNTTDGIQIGFDVEGSEVPDISQGLFFSIVAGTGENESGPAAIWEHFVVKGNPEGAVAKTTFKDSGYTMEVSIPWSVISKGDAKVTPADGTKVGFGFLGMDFKEKSSASESMMFKSWEGFGMDLYGDLTLLNEEVAATPTLEPTKEESSEAVSSEVTSSTDDSKTDDTEGGMSPFIYIAIAIVVIGGGYYLLRKRKAA